MTQPPAQSQHPSRDDLRRIQVLAGLSDAELDWLAERTTIRTARDGETFVRAGDEARHLHFMFEGELDYEGELNGQPVRFVTRAGEVAGVLPDSRMTHFPTTAHAAGPTRVGLLPREHFDALRAAVPTILPALLDVMKGRIRNAAQAEEQRERMSALGKLSAGLAHELNNPAAAVRRGADDLRRQLDGLPGLLADWLAAGGTAEQLQAVEAVVQTARDRAADPLSPLARSALEDDLADWLTDAGLPSPEARAADLIEAGVRADDLSGLAPAALAYLDFRLSSGLLLRDIGSAGGRISGLVASIKSYSHMDRGGARAPTDLRAGLDSTLTMLGHKLRDKNIQVTRDYAQDLPPIQAQEGELNQVWMNLIDNAIDALPPGGHITIQAAEERGQLAVRVIDDGPGVPPELQARIFEPFFTTKGVGEGSGLGLELAQRVVTRQHGGHLRLTSQPGRTEFLVLLPLDHPGGEDRT